MLKTPFEREQYLQKLEELEQKASGVFACITPERHRKIWEQKVSKLTQKIATAGTAEQRERWQQKLIELNHLEQKKANLIAEVHSLVTEAGEIGS